MGHERLGALPRSKRWRDIVEGISRVTRNEVPVATLADKTLSAVRTQFAALKDDDCTNNVFATLVRFAVACKGADDRGLRAVVSGGSLTPVAIARELHRAAEESEGRPEYGEIAAQAGADAVAAWFHGAKSPQEPLFESLRHPYETWRKLASGSGFCELSRLFFAKCTERYLNYFLEREASAAVPSVQAREEFRKRVEAHLASVSTHAFETAKITQSFSAGWFNKHAKDSVPADTEIHGFVAYSFDKLREALAKEAGSE